MLHNVVSVSAVQQSESAICIHISPPLKPPSYSPHQVPPLWVITEARLSSLCYTAASHSPFCTYGVYTPTLLSQCVPPCPSSPVPTAILYTCVSIPVSFLSRPHLQTPLGSHSSYFAEKPGVQPGLPGPPHSLSAKLLQIRASAVSAV